MSLLDHLFGPKVAKLEEKSDVDGLIAVVSSDARDDLRVAAIEALARLDAVATAPALVAEISAADAQVATAADVAVRSLGPAASGALVDALAGEEAERVLAILLDLGDAAVEPLRGAAESSDERIRRRALDGLLELDRRLAMPEVREAVFRALLASLGDRSPACRVIAASGLEDLGDPRAGRALAAQLKDGDETVRAACRTALLMIGEDAVPNIVDALYDRNANSGGGAAG
jgi:HEAT repeat protein